jgi:hypothetical protein
MGAAISGAIIDARNVDIPRCRQILVRIEGNNHTAIRVGLLVPKWCGAQAVIMKNTARDHFRDFCSTL